MGGIEIHIDARTYGASRQVRRKFVETATATVDGERAMAAALRHAAQRMDPDTRCLKCGKTRALHRTPAIKGDPLPGQKYCADGELFKPEPVR